MKIPKLIKSCPFCGDRSVITKSGDNYSIHCINCYAEIHGGNSEKKLIDKWNKRRTE